VKSEVEKTWGYIFDQKDFVIAQVAPAVRVAIGEEFGLDEGKDQIGLIAAALRRIGFNKVYDTTFTADLTIVEEATEFINRVKEQGETSAFLPVVVRRG
jgi:NADH-quinone oxidoreductase subunit G